MAISTNTIQCPACGASLSVQEGKEKTFCIYCGTPIQLTNENEYVVHHIHTDETKAKLAEAKIKQAEAEAKQIEAEAALEMRKLELKVEEEKRKRKIRLIGFGIAFGIAFLLILIGVLVGIAGGEAGVGFILLGAFIALFTFAFAVLTKINDQEEKG